MSQPQPPEPPKVEPIRTSITVVDRVESEAPASITVIDPGEMRSIPGANVDDRLRNIPGFSLFRRSSSVVANPTTQGISLRGISSSGASRTLVLWDGIPVNDAFGGWVYWTRFPPEELSRVEVSRGASTSLFGDRALGGAIHLFSREPEPRRLTARYEGGNRNSHDAGAGYSHLFTSKPIGLSATGRAYTTDGYYIVPGQIRGTVDSPAGVRFVTGDVRLDWLGPVNRFFLKSDILVEDRANGTVGQRNSTSLGTVSGRYFREFGDQSLSVLGFHNRQEYRASFSAIAANRNSERITYRQSVPAEGTGAAAVWSLHKSSANLLAGADVFRAEGYSFDFLVPTGLRLGGGTMLQHGVFAQADYSAGPAKFYAGGRHQFTGQDRTFFSPSAGAVVGRRWIRGRASVYRSFRAPTLNELFREFRAGNTATLPNAALKPETLTGVETGIDLVGESATFRVTAYRNRLNDLITNVTLRSTPAEITRQRQNAASALSRGVEVDAMGHWRWLRGEAGYLLVDSRFSTGERIPQIPRHQGSLQLIAQKNGTLVSAGVRSFAAQFDDDRNQFLLPGFATAQLMVRQQLTHGVSAIAAFENLLDRVFFTGFSPTPTIGAPRLWRVGLRWDGHL